MVTTDLGACEWFVWDLRRSNLLDRGQLDQVVGEFLEKNPRAEPPALAEFLVKEKILTQFQADRVLQGKTQGFVLGPFTLMDVLGSGSMGTVYKAVSKNDQEWYAVKVLPRRSMWNVRIARRKVRVFEQCKHPAVVPFVDVGTSGGMHYLAWPLVEGETLDQLVRRVGKLDPGQAACYVKQTVEGLDVCHQQGLFHGILKPSNLMIGRDQQVRILDFGIGSLLAETEGESLVDTMSTASSLASGLDCASPESIMDPTNLTPIGDQYSLGCVLYYCLAGQFPYPEGTAAEKMMA
ncbi:MAG TPA: serine/threonine-protein kinase, partial [Gemmataceae bacterium]|nr:serine/threonine-protein kinase [Gemmataceae bacterium]